MRVLLVGSGGREHAIAEAISRSKRKPELYAAMSHENPGIAPLCKEYQIIKETDPKIVDYAAEWDVKLAVIGPEGPLAAGIPDALWSVGIPVVGPRKLAAQVETDKAWTRNLMKKYSIDGLPEYRIFRKGESGSDEYIEELVNVAVKPAGLTGGKGVKLTGDNFDMLGAKNYAWKILTDSDLVIEKLLRGEEFTVQAFVDGNTLAFAPAVQDHKRAYDGNVKPNPNTGGMGSYNDARDILPFMRQSDYREAKNIMTDTVRAIKKETGVLYQGILYGQFMATAEGISVIEFNARFGDPEAINILPLLENDLLDVCEHVVSGTLGKIGVRFKKKATVCKYAVPEGYPDTPLRGAVIDIGEPGAARYFYSGVEKVGGKLYTTGSRAIASLGVADTLEEAERTSEQGILGLKGNIFSRHKIGTRELIEEKIPHMNGLMAN